MPVDTRFGAGCLDLLPDLVGPGARPALIVTGRRSARASGLLDRVADLLPGSTIFDGVDENPDTIVCERGARVARDAGAQGVVALGGGSAIDAAKAIALLAANPGRCADYWDTPDFPAPPLPLIAVPTTAGTGSEATPYAVLVDPAGPVKRTIAGPALFPRAAVLDPDLTRGLPRGIAVATGLDALSQAMEGMLSKRANPVGDTLAIEGCRLVRGALPQVARVADTAEDAAEARADMLRAAWLSGVVIAETGTTLVHGMGYLYTLRAGVPHGLANALILAPVFRVNARHQPERVARLAGALGAPCDATPKAAAAAITRAIHGLLADLDVSPAARDAGVPRAALDDYAREVAAQPRRFRNQWGDFDEDAIATLYRESHDGA